MSDSAATRIVVNIWSSCIWRINIEMSFCSRISRQSISHQIDSVFAGVRPTIICIARSLWQKKVIVIAIFHENRLRAAGAIVSARSWIDCQSVKLCQCGCECESTCAHCDISISYCTCGLSVGRIAAPNQVVFHARLSCCGYGWIEARAIWNLNCYSSS